MKGKKGANENPVMIFAVVVLVALVSYSLYTTNIASQEADGISRTDGEVNVCTDSSITMTHGPYVEWGSTTTVTDNVLWWEDGLYQGSATGGTSASVSPGHTIVEIASGNVNGGTYWAKALETQAPCDNFDITNSKYTKPYAIAGYKHTGNLNQMIPTGNADIKIFNDEGNKVDPEGDGPANSNVTLSANEQEIVTMKFDSPSFTGLAPYGGIVMTVEFNKSAIDRSEVLFSGGSPISTHSSYSPQLSSTSSDTMSWLIPGCPDVSAGEKFCNEDLGTLILKAKTQDISTSDGSAGVNVTFTYQTFDLNTQEDTLSSILFGVEDNTGTASSFAVNKTNIQIQ